MDSSILKPVSELARANKIHFPNESAEYRRARQALLIEEIELRRHIERVAELRRALPPGGEVTKKYLFEGERGKVALSDLFGHKQTLAIYSYMFGPRREKLCPMCTSFMGTREEKLPDVGQRVSFVFVARSPIARLIEAKKARGWTRHKVYSDVSGGYTRDYVSAADARYVGVRGADIVARVIARHIRIDLVPRPAARLLRLDQSCNRRARNEHERDALLDIRQLLFPRAHERRAHRAELFTLRPEHVAVDGKGLLVGEQI